jgi:heme-degrading monooxygenase HmoA
MYARVTQFRIQPGKVEEFQRTVRSVIPTAQKEKGFRGLFILRGGVEAPLEGHVISLWETLEDLRASEKSLYFYGALARVMRCCEGFPAILEQEVLCSEFRAA